MKRMIIILNPCAGTRQANKLFADIINIFSRAGFRCEVVTTGKRGDGTTITLERAKEFDLIVCIGGDGTYNEVVEGLMLSGANTPIGYIPAGSTNDFANTLGIPKDILEAAENIVEGEPKKMDVGSFDGRYFSYVASFGAFTRASYEAPQSVKNALGHLAYILEGIKDIPSIKPERLYLKTSKGTWGGDYLFGAISNSTSVGGILTLDESIVDLNDGIFEVLLIKSPSNILELNQILFDLSTQNYNSPLISFFSASNVEITADPKMPWTLDGEFQDGKEKITVSNIHNAVNIILK